MSQTAVRSARSADAHAVETSLRALGFVPGFPDHVTATTRAVDQGSARRRVCPSCRRRGLGLKPYQKAGSFRCVVACKCGFGEEV